QKHDTFADVLKHIGTYYGYRVSQIFDLLSEAIVLLAAVFTVAWMQRNNELLPLLSAGVSTRRVVMPVICSAGIMLSLTTLNGELILPRIGNQLMNPRDDAEGDKLIDVQAAYDRNGIHIEGTTATRRSGVIKPCYITVPIGVARNPFKLQATEARYVPPG